MNGMDISLAFAELFGILKEYPFSHNGSQVRVNVPNSEFTAERLRGIAKACGYESERNFIRENRDGFTLTINLRDGAFSIGKVFFSNFNELFFLRRNTKALPEFFFTLQEKESSSDEITSRNVLLTKAFFAWRKLLALLADHQDTSKNTYVFFISKDGIAKKYIINATVEFSDLVEISSPEICLETASYFINLLTIEGDAHKDERKSVMRSTLSEFMDANKKESNCFLSILCDSERLPKKYKELYDLYIHRFSINSLLNEIDTKSLEYLGKTNELISSIQTKALAIPGGLVAIGAFTKVNDFFNLLIVFSGFTVATLMTNKANEVHRETLKLIKHQVSQAFNKYMKSNEEKEIEFAASSSQRKIFDLIDKGEQRLDFIGDVSWFSMLGASVYMIIKLFS